jgi:hypothetical protein
MKSWRVLVGAAAFVAASAVSVGTSTLAQAQGGPPSPLGGGQGLNLDFSTLLKAKQGSWADYTMSKGGKDPIKIRYSLVERSASKLALEVDSATPKGEMILHFEFVPQGDAWKVVSGKLQLGDQHQDFPQQILAASPAMKASDAPGDLVGNEDVTTPLGALHCKHYKKSLDDTGKGPALDVWISDKVSPTGLVKSTMDAMGIQMTLLATGSGAAAKLP